MKPSIEVLEVELEQMIAESVSISNFPADVEGEYYKDNSREIDIFDED